LNKLSVIIATYNRGESLIRTLNSLAVQTLEPALWEVVVVDNNSADRTKELFGKFAAAHPNLDLKLVPESKQGLSNARNGGMAAAAGDIFVIIDDDQEVNGGFLEAYYDFFVSNPKIVAAGGKILPVYDEKPPGWLSRFTERPIAGTLDMGSKIRLFPKGGFPGGGNMALRRSVTEQSGLFDPLLGRTASMLLAGEEKDLFERISRLGHRFYYIPEAVVYHIIPKERMTRLYLERVSLMNGVSESIRTRGISSWSYFRRLIMEGVKWVATVIIALWYFATFRSSKGRYLMIMRYNVTKGLIKLA